MKKVINYIKDKKDFIVKFILSFLSYVGVSIYIKLPFYNIASVILFFIILKLYFNYNKKIDEKTKNYCITLSIVFSLFLSIGNIVYDNITITDIGFLNLKNLIFIILMFIGFVPLIYKLFNFIFLNLNKIKIIDKNQKMNFKLFICLFFIIIFLWLILFLRFFPAIISPDSYYVVNNVENTILSDHHTFGHTWFFAFFYKMGKAIFSTINGGVAFYTVFQMIIMALIYTFSIKYFYNRGLKKWICILLAFFIGLNPLYSRYSVTLWRDVLFGMSFVVLFLTLYDYIKEDFKVKKINVLLFTIFTIVMLFFRNNGIYVFLFITPFIIFIGKKQVIKKSIYFLIIIVSYFIIKGPIFNHFEVEKGKMSEAYSIPIQQISRVIASKKEIKEEDYEFLSNLYNVENAKENYDPVISDRMKETIDNEYLDENKAEFFKTWFSLLKQHPSLYFEAYFTQTLGYWYPDVKYWATCGEGESFFNPEFRTETLLPSKVNKVLDLTIARPIPFALLIWSIGTHFFLLITFTFISIYKFGKQHILYYIPFYGLWFTMLIASPVFAELRYVFGLFACMPFILITPFMHKNKK